MIPRIHTMTDIRIALERRYPLTDKADVLPLSALQELKSP
jgi:hypothetical protein